MPREQPSVSAGKRVKSKSIPRENKRALYIDDLPPLPLFVRFCDMKLKELKEPNSRYEMEQQLENYRIVASHLYKRMLRVKSDIDKYGNILPARIHDALYVTKSDLKDLRRDLRDKYYDEETDIHLEVDRINMEILEKYMARVKQI
jgi:hypothetical protein